MRILNFNKIRIVDDFMRLVACKVAVGLMFLCLFLVAFRYEVMAYDEIVIVIDPGHGGEVTGDKDDTNGGAMYHDLVEKDVNLATAKALRDELLEYGNVTVYLTREIDAALTLEDRVNFAEDVEADFLISVHYNASADHNYYGSEIFTSAFGECYAKGQALGECIMERWEDFGNTRKDIKTRIGNSGNDYYGLIRHATEKGIPAIILEHAYLDNDHDYLRINKESAWEELGQEDARGIAKYFGLEKGVVKASVEPTVTVEIPEDPVGDDTTPPVKVKLSVDSYNSNKGEVNFTLTGYDDESKLMYYGFVLDEADDDTVFEELEIWTGENGRMKGAYHVQPGYEGPLTAALYNVYQLHTVSNTVELIPDETIPDDEEDDATVEGEEDDMIGEEESSEGLEITNEIIMPTDDSNKEVMELGGVDEEVLDAAIAKAIEEETESTVDKSYKVLVFIGLFIAILLAIIIVLLITSASNKKKRRARRNMHERKSYDWMDRDD